MKTEPVFCHWCKPKLVRLEDLGDSNEMGCPDCGDVDTYPTCRDCGARGPVEDFVAEKVASNNAFQKSPDLSGGRTFREGLEGLLCSTCGANSCQGSKIDTKLEIDLEKRVEAWVGMQGGRCMKLTEKKGDPDRLVMLNGRVCFFELKRPDGHGVVSKHQEKTIDEFREMGFVARVSNDFEEIKRIVTETCSMDVHYSAKTIYWSTPKDFFDEIDAEFRFQTDVCATDENAKCKKYFTESDDGLRQAWRGSCWMNPPYGQQIKHWIKKAYESSTEGATVVCLVPARTDTRWWHDYIQPHAEVRFIKGRLKFGDSKSSAPFPNALAIFKPCLQKPTDGNDTGLTSSRTNTNSTAQIGLSIDCSPTTAKALQYLPIPDWVKRLLP